MIRPFILSLFLVSSTGIAADNYGNSPKFIVSCDDLILNGLIAVESDFLRFAPDNPSLFAHLPKKPKAADVLRKDKALNKDMKSWVDIVPVASDGLNYQSGRYQFDDVIEYLREIAPAFGKTAEDHVWEVALAYLKHGEVFSQSRKLIDEIRTQSATTDSDEFRLATTKSMARLREAREQEAPLIGWLMEALYKIRVPSEARFAFAQMLIEETQVAFHDEGHIALAENIFAWEIQRVLIFPEYAIAMMVKYYSAAKTKGGGQVVLDFALPLLRGQLKVVDDILLLNHKNSQLSNDFVKKILLPQFYKELEKGNLPLDRLEYFVKNNFYEEQGEDNEFSKALVAKPDLLDHPSMEEMIHKYPLFGSWYMRFVSELD